MKVCPICKNEADKLNVHLIPWFLIKNCITKEGSGVRDMEISFTIDPHNLTKMYAGRSILPETLESFREFKEIQKEKDNPYSRDNLICTQCEDKLSRLEAIFASQFTNKKLAAAFNGNATSVGNNPVVFASYNLSLYELLIQSIFYRCSIGHFNLFKLDKKVEKKIKENLRIAFAQEGFKKIKPSEQVEFPHKFPIITSAFYLSEEEDPTRYFITVNTSRFPYFIMAGRWMIRLYESEKHLKSSTEWLFGLNDKFIAVEAYKVTKKDPHNKVGRKQWKSYLWEHSV